MSEKQKKKGFLLVAELAILTLIAGCSSDPESEFLEQIRADLEKSEECMDMDNILGTNLLKADDDGRIYMMALEGEQGDRGREMLKRMREKGYVSGPEKTLTSNFIWNWKGSELTEKGKKSFPWKKGLCVGKRKVLEIVEYTEPADLGGMVMSEVKYKYEVILNDMVEELGLREVVMKNLESIDKEYFVKTNKGWRLK